MKKKVVMNTVKTFVAYIFCFDNRRWQRGWRKESETLRKNHVVQEPMKERFPEAIIV